MANHMRVEQFVDLRDSEEIVYIVRQHPVSHAFRFILFIFWILIPFILLYPLLQIPLFGVLAFLLFVGSAALYGFFAFRKWEHTAIILTTERIVDVDQRGWIERVVTEIPLSRVVEATYRTGGWFSAILRTGVMLIRTSQRFPDIEFYFTPHPARLARRIHELQREI